MLSVCAFMLLELVKCAISLKMKNFISISKKYSGRLVSPRPRLLCIVSLFILCGVVFCFNSISLFTSSHLHYLERILHLLPSNRLPKVSNPNFINLTSKANSSKLLKCGISNKERRALRMIGSVEAKKKEFPWVGYMVIYYKNGTFTMSMKCTATLIHPRWLITAAHCLSETTTFQNGTFWISKWGVALGVNHLDTVEQEVQFLYGHLSNTYTHPKYFQDVYSEYDVALLRLRKQAEISPSVNVICLPSVNDYNFQAEGVDVMITGFGQGEKGTVQKILQKIEARGMNYSTCQEKFPWSNITSNMMCTYVNSSNNCQGDSGSPVMYKTKQGSYVLIGIVSFTVTGNNGVCTLGYPTVHTFIPKVVDWIQNVTTTEPP